MQDCKWTRLWFPIDLKKLKERASDTHRTLEEKGWENHGNPIDLFNNSVNKDSRSALNKETTPIQDIAQISDPAMTIKSTVRLGEVMEVI
jgi:hypothetical protein